MKIISFALIVVLIGSFMLTGSETENNKMKKELEASLANVKFDLEIDTPPSTGATEYSTMSLMPANAAVNSGRHLLGEIRDHFNRQSKTDCVKWLETKFPPMKICIGHRTQWRCFVHRYYLVYSGPKSLAEMQTMVTNALNKSIVKTALAALMAALVSGPAALEVAKIVFLSTMADEMGREVQLDVIHEGGWTNWGGC